MNNKLPNGWTETKIDENLYKLDIPQSEIDKWTLERRKADKFDKIIKKNGFYIKPSGRAGIIYYVNNENVCEIDFEMSGVKQYDLLIFFDSLTHWSIPKDVKITGDEINEIKDKLIDFLKSKRIKTDL